jgi:hypothetical protein
MRNLDFLPDAYRQARRQRRLRRHRLGLGAACLCLLASWFGADELRIRGSRRQLACRAGQNETVQAGLDQIARLQIEQTALLDRYRLLQDLDPSISSVQTVFRIAQLLPENVALRRMQMTCGPAASPGGAPATPSKTRAQPASPSLPRVALSGIALSEVDIAVLVGQLSSCREFANVRLDYCKAAEVESRRVQEFRVSFDVPGQAAASQLTSGA